MEIIRKLYDFQGVAANAKATVNLRNLLGLTVDRIVLQLGGTFTKAQMTRILIRANTKPIFDDTGSNNDLRMQYRGLAANAAYMSLDFTEPRARTIVGQKLGALDTTAGIADLTAEIDIGGATSPTLSGYAICSEPQSDLPERGIIAAIKRVTKNFAAAGTFPFELEFGRLAPILIKRLHFFGSTVTSVEVRRNSIPVFENVPDALNDFVQGEYQRTPQSNVYTVDFVRDGNQSNALQILPGMNMEYRLTVSGSGNVECVAEVLDVLPNI